MAEKVPAAPAGRPGGHCSATSQDKTARVQLATIEHATNHLEKESAAETHSSLVSQSVSFPVGDAICGEVWYVLSG